MSFLYRGISKGRHEQNSGLLIPKDTGPFEYHAKWDEAVWDSGETWDSSATNAVVRHQREQRGLPTSGISTTPHIRRAEFYATQGGKTSEGILYKIDRSILSKHGVTEFVVKEYATSPSVPEDDEVILVLANYGPLPAAIVVAVISISREVT